MFMKLRFFKGCKYKRHFSSVPYFYLSLRNSCPKIWDHSHFLIDSIYNQNILNHYICSYYEGNASTVFLGK